MTDDRYWVEPASGAYTGLLCVCDAEQPVNGAPIAYVPDTQHAHRIAAALNFAHIMREAARDTERVTP